TVQSVTGSPSAAETTSQGAGASASRRARPARPGPLDNNQAGMLVPVLAWEDLELLTTNNDKLAGARLPTLAPELTNFVKFVAMPDDSMEPDVLCGDHLLFDPALAPAAGDIVLVRLMTGEHFVRTYRPRSSHHFQAAAINTHYQSLSSDLPDSAAV